MNNSTQKIFEFKYRLYRPQAFALLEEIEKSQYFAEDRIEVYQNQKRRALVKYVMNKSPFYKKLYSDVGFELRDVEQEDFFEKLPVITKNHIRRNFETLLVPGQLKNRRLSSTGGSTGVPTKFGYDKRYPFEALSWRMMSWWGIRPWDHGAYVWRNPRVTKISQLANRMVWWPTKKIRLDASSMSPESMRLFIRQFNELKPPLLQGYVGAVDELAKHLLSYGGLKHYPKAIWLTSAPILPVQRSLIEEIFKAPVYDQYGCCEVPNIAAQCECRKGLHVNFESVGVEFVDNNNMSVTRGEWGRTLLTKYDEFVFPLIRYEVGDMGRLLNECCSCGRMLPLMDQVKGRTTDVIRLPSGRVLSGEYLTTIFDAYPNVVRGFRVTQKKDKNLEVDFIPVNYNRDKIIFFKVEKILQDKINKEIAVRLNAVDEISHDRGKLRFVVREE